MINIVSGELNYVLIRLLLSLTTSPLSKKILLVIKDDNNTSDVDTFIRDRVRALATKNGELLSALQLDKIKLHINGSREVFNDLVAQIESGKSFLGEDCNEITVWEVGEYKEKINPLNSVTFSGNYIKKHVHICNISNAAALPTIAEHRFANVVEPIEKYLDIIDSPLSNYVFKVLDFASSSNQKNIRVFLPETVSMLFISSHELMNKVLFNEGALNKEGDVEILHQLKINAREFVSSISVAAGLSIDFLNHGRESLNDYERSFSTLLADSGLNLYFDDELELNSKIKALENNVFLQKISKDIQAVISWRKNITVDSQLFANEKKHIENFNFSENVLNTASKLDINKYAIFHALGDVKYSELSLRMNRCVTNIVALKIKPGSKVAIVANDSPQFAIALLALVYAGCTAIIINPQLKPSSVIAAIRSSKVIAVFSDADFLSTINKAEKGQLTQVLSWECLDKLFFITNIEPDECVETSGKFERNIQEVEWSPAYTRPFDFAIGMFTSGTTGVPKLIFHRHQDFVVAAERYAAQVLNLNTSDRALSVSRMSFSFGLHNFFNALFHGATAIISPQDLSIKNIIETIKRYKPTVFYAVPTVYQFLLSQDQLGEKDFKTIRCFVSAGDRLPIEFNRKFQNKFGLPILDSLGSTEAYSTYLTNIPGFKGAYGAAGKIVPGFDAKIINERGVICACGEVGTLWLKGPALLSRYENDEVASSQRFKDGWYCTNDMLERDRDGFYYYFGRADDVIKVSGQWVSPQEIENVLLSHPDVIEAAVIAVGDSETTTRPKTFVVTNRNDHQQLVDELKSFVKEKLECWKYPHLIQFVNELPKTVTGKLQRHQLRKTCLKTSEVAGENYVAAN